MSIPSSSNRPISRFYTINYGEKLGTGLTGSVYKAVRKCDKVVCAVKVIRRSPERSREDSVVNETRALRILDHTSIVKVLDKFEDKINFYIILEYVFGDQLYARILHYCEEDVRNLCRSILSALHHCHSRDIVHCDIKGDNILVNPIVGGLEIKLIDFGFAKCAADSSLTGKQGTSFYMAPEIWSGLPYGKPVDLWAFGVMTFILLYGHPPFFEKDQSKLIEKIQSADFMYPEDTDLQCRTVGAKDFISSLLTLDSQSRLTVEQALSHPWVRNLLCTIKSIFKIKNKNQH